MKRVVQVLLPLTLLAAGGLIAAVLIWTKPTAAREPPAREAVSVRVEKARVIDKELVIDAFGTVMPARQLGLTSEVQGRVTRVAPDFSRGGLVKKGQLLVKIDSRDYEAAAAQARARLEQARVALQVEKGQRTVAEKEFALAKDMVRPEGEAKELALREPQIASARAQVESAREALQQARRKLGDTSVKAPLNALVQDGSVEVGQLVGPGAPLATLVGTDTFWVEASVSLGELEWFDVPQVNAEKGAPVRVTLQIGQNERAVRSGRVLRMLPGLDPQGRMAKLLVEVDDPLAMEEQTGPVRDYPLLLNAYVRVEIEGRRLVGVVPVPRSAVWEEDNVWVVGPRSQLQKRKLDIVWRDEDDVYAKSGVEAGDQIVVSRVEEAVEGLEVRIREQGEQREDLSGRRTDAGALGKEGQDG